MFLFLFLKRYLSSFEVSFNHVFINWFLSKGREYIRVFCILMHLVLTLHRPLRHTNKTKPKHGANENSIYGLEISHTNLSFQS